MNTNTFFYKCVRHSKWLIESIRGYFKFKKLLKDSCYVFISHNGDSAGGAPVVLFELVRSLKDDNQIIFLCEKPGGIIHMCNNEGIPAFSTYLVQRLYLKKIVNKKVKGVVINTLASYKSASYLNNAGIKCPILWWVHEEKGLVSKYAQYIPQKLAANLKILCVSNSVQNNLLEYCPQCNGKTDIFYYGCRDLFYDVQIEQKKTESFIISVIGRICSRKNQIQVVRAYNMIPKSYRDKIQINFVSASNDPKYLAMLRELISENDKISFVGPIDRNQMYKIYAESDLIICSSTDDPLPVVITEAMMLKRPFITSSRTGHFDIIDDGVNGFTYNVDSTEQLAQKILEIYNSPNLNEICEQSRMIYLNFFTPEKVKEKFMNILQ